MAAGIASMMGGAIDGLQLVGLPDETPRNPLMRL